MQCLPEKFTISTVMSKCNFWIYLDKEKICNQVHKRKTLLS